MFLLLYSVGQAGMVTAQTSDKESQNIIRKFIRYFEEANRPHPEKTLDISFIGGPHYSTESGLGIGIVGSGLYYTRRDQSGKPTDNTPVSQLSLKFDISTGQLYKVGAEGYHIFPGDKYRINYDAYFYSFKDKYWGIGYENDIVNTNASIFKRLQAQVKLDFVINFGGKFFIGPLARFSFNKAMRVDRPDLFEGQPYTTTNTGIGVTTYFDSRDVPFNAYRGAYIRFTQLFHPDFFGNKYAFSQSELMASAYKRLWKGGVLAVMYHADITYGNTPWGLMPTFGGSERMRGYYEGRFRDKCEMDITVELRQHVWRRNGLVFWLGAGSVFPKLSEFKLRHVLPNIGIGYRWQFKPRINVRVDLGIGKDEYGFNFSINEAF